MALEKSAETSRPNCPDFRMFLRTSSIPSGVGLKVPDTTLPPAKPSRTISMKRTLGVKIEVTRERSTPEMK